MKKARRSSMVLWLVGVTLGLAAIDPAAGQYPPIPLPAPARGDEIPEPGQKAADRGLPLDKRPMEASGLFGKDRPEFDLFKDHHLPTRPATPFDLPPEPSEEDLKRLLANPAADDATKLQLRLLLAQRATQACDWAKARSEATRAIEIDSTSFEAHSARFTASEKLGLCWLAIADLDRMLRLAPDLPSVHQFRGYLLTECGHYEEGMRAIEVGQALAQDDAGLAQGYLARGMSHQLLGDHEVALAEFDEAARLDPSNPAIDSWRGQALLRLRQFDRSIVATSRAIDKLSEPSILNCRGLAYLYRGDFAPALGDFDRVPEGSDQFRQAMVGRGVALLMLGRVAEAEEALERAITLEPDWALPREARGWAWMARGDLDKAIASFAAASDRQGTERISLGVNAWPGFAIPLRWRGGQDQTDQAIGEYNRAFGESPGPPWSLIVRSGPAARSRQHPEAERVVFLIHRPAGQPGAHPDLCFSYIHEKGPQRGGAFGSWGEALARALRSEWGEAANAARLATLSLIDSRIKGSTRTRPGFLVD